MRLEIFMVFWDHTSIIKDTKEYKCIEEGGRDILYLHWGNHMIGDTAETFHICQKYRPDQVKEFIVDSWWGIGSLEKSRHRFVYIAGGRGNHVFYIFILISLREPRKSLQ